MTEQSTDTRGSTDTKNFDDSTTRRDAITGMIGAQTKTWEKAMTNSTTRAREQGQLGHKDAEGITGPKRGHLDDSTTRRGATIGVKDAKQKTWAKVRENTTMGVSVHGTIRRSHQSVTKRLPKSPWGQNRKIVS